MARSSRSSGSIARRPRTTPELATVFVANPDGTERARCSARRLLDDVAWSPERRRAGRSWTRRTAREASRSCTWPAEPTRVVAVRRQDRRAGRSGARRTASELVFLAERNGGPGFYASARTAPRQRRITATDRNDPETSNIEPRPPMAESLVYMNMAGRSASASSTSRPADRESSAENLPPLDPGAGPSPAACMCRPTGRSSSSAGTGIRGRRPRSTTRSGRHRSRATAPMACRSAPVIRSQGGVDPFLVHDARPTAARSWCITSRRRTRGSGTSRARHPDRSTGAASTTRTGSAWRPDRTTTATPHLGRRGPPVRGASLRPMPARSSTIGRVHALGRLRVSPPAMDCRAGIGRGRRLRLAGQRRRRQPDDRRLARSDLRVRPGLRAPRGRVRRRTIRVPRAVPIDRGRRRRALRCVPGRDRDDPRARPRSRGRHRADRLCRDAATSDSSARRATPRTS